MRKQIIFGMGPEFMARDHLTEKVQPWEDGLRTNPRHSEFEWWYFDAHFDDGSTAVIVFYTKSIINPKGAFKPTISITITPPDGCKRFETIEVPASRFTASTRMCRVRCGANTVEGDLRAYRLHVRGRQLGADLAFSTRLQPWRPGSGKNFYDPSLHSYFAWLPAMPFGRCEGTLTFDGRTRKVKGEGYHDHNWGNVFLGRILDHWYWGRASVGDYRLIFVEMNATRAFGRTKIPVLLVAKKGRLLVEDARPLKLVTSGFVRHPGGHAYPLRLDFDWRQGQDRIHIALRKPQLIEATSLLGMLPAWQQKLAGLFVRPYYFRFNAGLALDISLGGKHRKEAGRALYEMMILH
jgi:hypothetical protein